MEKELSVDPCIEYDDREDYKLKIVQPEKTSKKFKLIIVGESNVGKSTIINRFCSNVYQNIPVTVGMDLKTVSVKFQNKTISLIIWDTAGTEKYRSLANFYYRGVHGIFIVYDITNLNSILKLNDWIKDIENIIDSNVVKILVGDKCDDKSNRATSFEEGQEVAKHLRIPFLEVSSKTNENIDKLLYTMISKIYTLEPTTNMVKLDKSQKQEPQKKSSKNLCC